VYKLLNQRILGGLSIQIPVKIGSTVMTHHKNNIVLIQLPVDTHIMEKHTVQIIYTTSFCIQH